MLSFLFFYVQTSLSGKLCLFLVYMTSKSVSFSIQSVVIHFCHIPKSNFRKNILRLNVLIICLVIPKYSCGKHIRNTRSFAIPFIKVNVICQSEKLFESAHYPTTLSTCAAKRSFKYRIKKVTKIGTPRHQVIHSKVFMLRRKKNLLLFHNWKNYPFTPLLTLCYTRRGIRIRIRRRFNSGY